MTTFSVCIEQAVKAGKITKDIAERLASASDPDQELTNIVANISRQKRETVTQAVRISDAWQKASGWSGKKGADPLKGINALLSRDIQGVAGYENVEMIARQKAGAYHADFVEAMQHFRTRKLGWSQNEVDLQKLIKAIYGEPVDDPQMKVFADQWHKLNERMRNDFNSVGGSISKNERYLMPQSHDVRAILSLGKSGKLSSPDLEVAKAKWKDYIKPLLDIKHMLDDSGRTLSPEELDELLDYSFESIVTNGVNKSKDLTVPRFGKKLARKHSERRTLYFKDADSWMKYQRDFGRGDVFSTLTGHINTMAHDVALMKTLGPSPESTYKTLVNMAEKKMKGIPGHRKGYSQALYNVVSGKVNGGELLTLADLGNVQSNILVSSTLGGAFLSAISDIGFNVLTSKYRGMPAFRALGKQLRLMKSEELQVFAVKTGLMADGMIGRMHAANRHADIYGTGVTSKISESVMRASLLEPWTNSGRWAFGLSMQQEFAQNFGKQFDELDDALRKGFGEYGITQSDWDAFRKSKPMKHDGVQYADLTQPGGEKFSMYVHGEMDFAVPTPDARVRAITTGGYGRATVAGQAWRAAMMFKSFPIGLFMGHFMRAAYQATTAGKLAYLGSMMATTTVLGGIALQMKDIAKGRDPREMFDDEGFPIVDDEFMAAAIMQGGGLGIFGDLVFSDYTRFGQSFTESTLGPKFQMVNDTFKLLQLSAAGVRDVVASGETNVLGDAVQYINRYTPDVWQTTLFSNAFFDQMELLVDPKAQKKFNRMMRSRKKDYGQEYWWKPGELAPDRAPDFNSILGD